MIIIINNSTIAGVKRWWRQIPPLSNVFDVFDVFDVLVPAGDDSPLTFESSLNFEDVCPLTFESTLNFEDVCCHIAFPLSSNISGVLQITGFIVFLM